MTKQELHKLLSQRFEDNCCREFARTIQEHGLIEDAMEIALEKKGSQPFRAAYALEMLFFDDPASFEPYYKRFVSDYTAIENESTMRHYGKIVVWLLKNKKLDLPCSDINSLAETACIRLVDESIKSGVKVWCMEILTLLSSKVEWVREEFPGILESLSIDPPPAIASRLRKLGYVKNKQP